MTEIVAIGYQVVFTVHNAYDGDTPLPRHALSVVAKRIPEFKNESQRIVAATIDGALMIFANVQNRKAVEDRNSISSESNNQWRAQMNFVCPSCATQKRTKCTITQTPSITINPP